MDWNSEKLINNINPGIEYEYALYYCLVNEPEAQYFKTNVINVHPERAEIEKIAEKTDITPIEEELSKRHLRITDCALETQNDAVGPSDIVMELYDEKNKKEKIIGISVKYQNSCTLNTTGALFLSEEDKKYIRSRQVDYTKEFINDMSSRYGEAKNWFRERKSSKITDSFIDLIRDAVIKNWDTLANKEFILRKLFQMDSPIDYWIYEYKKNSSAILYVNPPKIELSKINEINIRKYDTSYISFHLGEKMIGKMQVKFNNGILERCKKTNPDFVVDGIKMSLGSPLSSWNFSVIY